MVTAGVQRFGGGAASEYGRFANADYAHSFNGSSDTRH